ncbi:inhibin beta C chain-like [Hydractinia symbiolongicarpus]|uniref:inhibin beta C chain-like n=1 Tax=Hydractinia symbiolongicarpus TaxID=13093 RepID=UPI00254D1360|nr:inhibin beta C chain-like [Hydractinia symbiolongicarpus]
MCSYLWYSFVTAVISTVVVCSPLKTDKSANSVEDLHIELIKKKILEQLHFTTRPPKEIRRGKIVVPRPALDDDKNDDKREENKVEILLPSETKSTLSHTFSVTADVFKQGHVEYATLSVYKKGVNKDGVETVTLKYGNKILQRKTFPVTFAGWVTFDVGNAIKYHKGDKITFSFVCSQCAGNNDFLLTSGTKYTPYLTVRASLNRHKIVKRSTPTCSDKKACCLQYLYVNFTEIGWNDWVKEPNGFVANYCAGKCSQNPLKNKLSLEKLAGYLPPSSCCIAKEHAPLTLYFHRDMVIYKKVFKNLVTTKCGCT